MKIDKEKSNYKSIGNTNNYQNNSDSEIDYKELIQGVLRKKKWALITGFLTFFGIIAITINERINNPVYRGSFKILIKDPLDSGTKPKDTLLGNSSSFYQDLASNSKRYDVNSLISLLGSPKYLEPLAKQFNLNPESLSNSINIDVPNSSNQFRTTGSVLNVNLRIKNKTKGMEVLEALSVSFLKESLKQRQRKINDGLNFLEDQLPKIQQNEDFLQSQLVTFRKENKLISPIDEGLSLKTDQKAIDAVIVELESIGIRLNTVREEVLKGSLTARGFNEVLGDGLTVSDFDQSLLSQLIAVEKELAIAKSKFTPSSSIVKGLELRLNQLQPIILKNQIQAVDIAINLNSGRLENAKKVKQEIEEKFLKQPILIKEFQRIEEQLKIANIDLRNLKSAIASFELELAQSNIPWRIISEPKISPKPIKPSLKRNTLYAIILSAFFGITVAIIRDKFDHVFRSSKDVEESLNLPILGDIPYIQVFSDIREDSNNMINILEEKNIVNKEKTLRYQRFFYTEALRNLYTSIRFLNFDTPIKTLSITSSIPREGKSLLNILLAKTLTEMGERVLLIDADLRKPQIHSRLNINNILGLTNLLTDNQITLDQVINPLKGFENLSVITSGTIPPDPTRLLNSKRFKEFVDELKASEEYDMILFDSPPVLGLADSIILSENLDGFILLISLGGVDRSLPKDTLNKVKTNRSNFLGAITNSIKNQYSIEYSEKWKYKGYQNYRGYNPYQTYSSYIKNDENKTTEFKDDIKNNVALSEKFSNVFVDFKKIKNNFLKWLDS